MSFFHKWFLFFISIFFPIICSFPVGAETNYPYSKGNFIYFSGEGKANQSTENQTQKRSMAQEAAILDGKAKIALYIDNLKTKKGEMIKEAIKKDKKIERKVHAFLMNVEIGETSWDEQDNSKTILKINKKSLLKSLKAKE